MKSCSPIFGRRRISLFLPWCDVALVLPLFLLVLELAKVHDAADGRLLQRGDLDQIEPDLLGFRQSLVASNHAQLRAIVADDSKGRRADLFVDPLLLAFDC